MATIEAPRDKTTPLILRVSDWTPRTLPVQVGPDVPRTDGAIRWFELAGDASAAKALTERLAPQCQGLTVEMVEDLLSPDDEPLGNSYEHARIKLASSCAIETRSELKERRGTANSVGGELVIAPVELLAGEDWLLSCWHPARVFHGAEEVREEPAPDLGDLHDALSRRWARGTGENAGDLGVILLHELALGYGNAHWEVARWLEDWELAFHAETDPELRNLDEHRRSLTEIWGSMAVLRDWIRPQNRSGLSNDIDRAWLPANDPVLVEEVDDRIDRALDNIRQLGEHLRSCFNVLHVEQLEEARGRREQVMRRIELAAAAFLIPSLVVGFYGSNTWLPGQGSHVGFWAMIAVVLILSILGLALVRRWQDDDQARARAKAPDLG
jgi:hypothetical protein